MKRNFKNIAIIASIVSGVAGRLLFSTNKVIGTALIVAGLVGAIWTYFSSQKRRVYDDELFDEIAKLLATNGVGNPYTKIIERRLSKVGTHKNVFAPLDKALEINPNDSDALALYVLIAASHISLQRLIVPENDPAYKKATDKLKRMIEHGIKLGKRLAEFYQAKGVLSDVMGKHKEARSCFLKAAQLQPGPFWRLLTCTSYGMEGDHLGALSEVEKAIAEGAKGYLVDYYHGRCLACIGEFETAISKFQDARRARGLFYQLTVSMQEAYYYLWHPIKSSYWELLSAVYVFRGSKRKALLHVGMAASHCLLPMLIPLSRLVEKGAKRVPILRDS